MDAPALLTFDIFGTVVDWKTGFEQACAAHGRPLREGELDRIIDAQGELEQASAANFDSYTSIVLKSLVTVLGLPAQSAADVAASVGRFPLFADSREGLQRLLAVAKCAATTNSDLRHGEQVREQLGFPLSDWICAEEVRHYKPSIEVWHRASERLGVPFGPDWWHVSAYADYDLRTAQAAGLTTVMVGRPHQRPGPADITVPNLRALGAMVETLRPRLR
jgi:2-haloalkanoic acid dehalogenase type II